MIVISDPALWTRVCRRAPRGFVPTMGALHAGHLALVGRALDTDGLAGVSIFVNPTQFNNAQDLEKYPRTLEADCAALASLDPGSVPAPACCADEAAVDAAVAAGHSPRIMVFSPAYGDLYPEGYAIKVTENQWASLWCGAHRPGHFDGVLSVVLKLLNLSTAPRAYFGEKDYQQLRLIQRMATGYFLPTNIVACPIVRETDGLAMSSRNVRLSPGGRAIAPEIHATLQWSLDAIPGAYDPEPRPEVAPHLSPAAATLAAQGMDVEYLGDWYPDGPTLPGRRLVALWLDGVRLIDNLALAPAGRLSAATAHDTKEHA